MVQVGASPSGAVQMGAAPVGAVPVRAVLVGAVRMGASLGGAVQVEAVREGGGGGPNFAVFFFRLSRPCFLFQTFFIFSTFS